MSLAPAWTTQEELVSIVPNVLRDRLDSVIDGILLDFGGGSGLGKAMTSAALIIRYNLQSYVEIGVYRRRSLLPVGATFSWVKRGLATGIDPWSVSAATQQDIAMFPAAAATVNEFVAGLDWDAMFVDVSRQISELGIDSHCTLVRATAADAAARFAVGSIDILHIDGNHDESAVLNDIDTYLSKVSPDGFVILDDASWESVRSAREQLERDYTLIFEDRANDFALFSKAV